MIKGHCLCGGIQYEYDGQITELAVCHCDQCKHAQGTPLATNAPIDFSQFNFLSGEDLLTSFFSSPDKRRVFCSRCGSPLFSQRTDAPNTIRLRVGTVSEGNIPEPNYQIYCESRSAWFSLSDDKPEYLEGKTE